MSEAQQQRQKAIAASALREALGPVEQMDATTGAATLYGLAEIAGALIPRVALPGFEERLLFYFTQAVKRAMKSPENGAGDAG